MRSAVEPGVADQEIVKRSSRGRLHLSSATVNAEILSDAAIQRKTGQALTPCETLATWNTSLAGRKDARSDASKGMPASSRSNCSVTAEAFQECRVFGTMYVKCGGYAIEYTCACFDISARGVGLEVAGPITVGSFVTVYAGERGPRHLARVRYCVQEDDTYRAGLEFTGDAVARC